MTQQDWDYLPKTEKMRYWQIRLAILRSCTEVRLNSPEYLQTATTGDKGIRLLAAGENNELGYPSWTPGLLVDVQKRALDEMIIAVQNRIVEIEATD